MKGPHIVFAFLLVVQISFRHAEAATPVLDIVSSFLEIAMNVLDISLDREAQKSIRSVALNEREPRCFWPIARNPKIVSDCIESILIEICHEITSRSSDSQEMFNKCGLVHGQFMNTLKGRKFDGMIKPKENRTVVSNWEELNSFVSTSILRSKTAEEEMTCREFLSILPKATFQFEGKNLQFPHENVPNIWMAPKYLLEMVDLVKSQLKLLQNDLWPSQVPSFVDTVIAIFQATNMGYEAARLDSALDDEKCQEILAKAILDLQNKIQGVEIEDEKASLRLLALSKTILGNILSFLNRKNYKVYRMVFEASIFYPFISLSKSGWHGLLASFSSDPQFYYKLLKQYADALDGGKHEAILRLWKYAIRLSLFFNLHGTHTVQIDV